jgi:hypothetical protein
MVSGLLFSLIYPRFGDREAGYTGAQKKITPTKAWSFPKDKGNQAKQKTFRQYLHYSSQTPDKKKTEVRLQPHPPSAKTKQGASISTLTRLQ